MKQEKRKRRVKWEATVLHMSSPGASPLHAKEIIVTSYLLVFCMLYAREYINDLRNVYFDLYED